MEASEKDNHKKASNEKTKQSSRAPTRTIKIVEQNFNLNILTKSSTVEGVTTMRICASNEAFNLGTINFGLCAKQIQVTNFEVSEQSMLKVNPEKNSLKNFSNETYNFTHNYPDTDLQVKVHTKNLLRNCQKNVHSLINMTKDAYKIENEGYLKALIKFKTPFNIEIDNLFDQGYLCYFTVKIYWYINNPICGAFFKQNKDKSVIFMKENKTSFARNIIPCLDGIDDYYKVGEVKIAVDDPEMLVFASGILKSVQQTKDSKVFHFSVQKRINLSYFGVIAGKFHELSQTLANNVTKKIYIEGKENYERWSASVKELSDMCSLILEFEHDYLKIENSVIKDFDIVALDNICTANILNIPENPMMHQFNTPFYYRVTILDANLLIDSKSLDDATYIQTDLIKRVMSSLLLECFYLKSINDFWMFVGMISFIADIFLLNETDEYFFQDVIDKKRNMYYKYTKDGLDLISLVRPNFFHPAQAFYDECYILKSTLIFYLMYSHQKLTNKNMADFQSLPMIERSECCKPNSTFFKDTKHFFKKVRIAFGVKNLKANLSQFLYNTGCIQFDCVYSYNRKENKMKLTLRQTPIQLEYYKKVMETRFRLEKYFNKESSLQKLMRDYRNHLYKLQEDSEGIIENDNVVAFLENDGRILMNSCLNSLKYMSCSFLINVTETNDIEFRDDIYDINLSAQQDQEVSFFMRTKFRRVIQKKGLNDDQEQYGHNQYDGTMLSSKYSDNANTKVNQYGDQHGSNMIGGSPYLWIKIDPYNQYLKKMLVKEGEKEQLAQFEKDLRDQHFEISNIYRIQEGLKNYNTQIVVNRLIYYLNLKELNYLIKIHIIDTLIMLFNSPNHNRISDVLLSLIKKQKFESDNSLRSNNFNSVENYHLLNHLIRVVGKFDKMTKTKNTNKHYPSSSSRSNNTDENIVHILLTLLQKNDNSLNRYDDTYYQANILKAQLKCTNIGYFKKIIKEVVRFQNIEFYTKYEQKYLILVIFKYFIKYVNTHLEIMGYSLRDNSISIYKNNVISNDQDLSNAFNFLGKQVKRYKCDITFAKVIFKQKLYTRFNIQKHKTWDVIIWGLKYIEKIRNSHNPQVNTYIIHILMQEFYSFLKKNQQQFIDMQMPQSLNNNKLIADLLWENINNPYSTLDVYCKHYALRVYYTIYDDFVPICFMIDSKQVDNVPFTLDHRWMNFKFELNFERSIITEKKQFTLNYLCQQKRKKASSILGATGSHNVNKSMGATSLNIQSILLQNFKFSKENLNWKNLGKQILNILLSERATTAIENELGGNDEANLRNEIVIELRLNSQGSSLKDVKNKLSKIGSIENLQQLGEEILAVINSYYQKEKISEEFKNEYIKFVEALLDETDKLLKKKANREDRTRRM